MNEDRHLLRFIGRRRQPEQHPADRDHGGAGQRGGADEQRALGGARQIDRGFFPNNCGHCLSPDAIDPGRLATGRPPAIGATWAGEMLRRRVAAHRARPFGEARTGRERHGLGGTRRILIDCTIIFGVGLVLALVGPFGSFAAPFGLRLLYWLAMSYAGYFLYFPAMAGATALAPRLELPEPALWAAACLLATLPMTA
ncbi:conserved hypothetical protein, partial [Ricinus communis]